MNKTQARKQLAALGFDMAAGTGIPDWGKKDSESFNYTPHHIRSKPFRDVFIGKAKGGWYITSSIHFKARLYRYRYEFTADILNIFGKGSTLAQTVADFEHNYRNRIYNGFNGYAVRKAKA